MVDYPEPNDGVPYHCNACGLGFDEFMACEECHSAMESDAEEARHGRRA